MIWGLLLGVRDREAANAGVATAPGIRQRFGGSTSQPGGSGGAASTHGCAGALVQKFRRRSRQHRVGLSRLGPAGEAGAGAEIMAAAAGRTGQGGRGRLRRAPPAPVPPRGPRWQAIGRPRGGGGLGAYGRRAGVLALAGAGRMKGHSCYAMYRAGAALGERTANRVLTDTRQDGHTRTLDGSQRPERVLIFLSPFS